MNKSEFIAEVAEKAGATNAIAQKIINAAIETIEEKVSSGERVVFVGFGTFEKVSRAARMGRNPATGAEMKIPASNIPKFSPGAVFKNKVNS